MSNVEINIQSKLMSGIFVTPLCDDCPTQTNCTSVCSLCNWSHTFLTTGVNKFRKKSMATCHYLIAWEEQLFSAQLRADVKQYYQSDKAMYMWIVWIMHTHKYVFTHGALGISVNEHLTGSSQLINNSIKRVGRSFSLNLVIPLCFVAYLI